MILTVTFYNSTHYIFPSHRHSLLLSCLFATPRISSRTLETEAGETQGHDEDHRLRQRLAPRVGGRGAEPRGA